MTNKRLIVIDAGHGGKDLGAVGNGLYEKNLTLNISQKIKDILLFHGLDVVMTRENDSYVSLSERVNIANTRRADLFVSVHINAFNSPSANGVETFSFPGSTKKSDILSKFVQDELVKTKLFKSNRGTKTANFQVLRDTNMTAILTELGFITNYEDSQIMKNKQDELAIAVSRGVLGYLKISYKGVGNPQPSNPNIPPITNGTPIMSKSNAAIEQMQEWARKKKANQLFIDLAPTFYNISVNAGVNPLVTYAQSAKETGYMKFGGVLNASFNNPCGMKVSAGGGDKDPNAHMRFASWNDGIQAQVDHLALYAGGDGYPKANSPDPRHFPYLKGTAKTVESLGGKWAPSLTYGKEIVEMMRDIEKTIISVSPSNTNDTNIKINLLGRIITVKGKFKDDTNYITIDGKDIPIRSVFEPMGLSVGWENNTIIIK